MPFFISGCATGQFEPDKVATEGFSIQGKTGLYANLEEIDGTWRFIDIAAARTDERFVELGSYRNTGWSEPRTCVRGILGLAPGYCGKNSEFATTGYPDASNLLIPLMWPIGLVAAIGAPTDSAMYFGVFVRQSFDWDDYMSAVQEAKSVEEYDQRLPDLYSRYTYLLANNDTSPARQNFSEFLQNSKHRHEAVKKELTTSLLEQIEIQVIDNSGLIDSNIKASIKDHIAAKVSFNREPSFQESSYASFQNPSIEINNLLPATDLNDFGQKITKYERELARIREHNAGQLETNTAAALLYWTGKEGLSEFRPEARRSNGVVEFSHNSTPSWHMDYSYRLDFPESPKFKNGKLAENTRATITVASRNFRSVMPTSYSHSNSDLALEMRNDMITIKNNTNEYVLIDAISLYYGDDVLTRSGDSSSELLTLAPRSQDSFTVGSTFSLNKLDNNFYGITRSVAKTTSINFGFAVKYQITQSGAQRTLYRAKPFNLFEVTMN